MTWGIPESHKKKRRILNHAERCSGNIDKLGAVLRDRDEVQKEFDEKRLKLDKRSCEEEG